MGSRELLHEITRRRHYSRSKSRGNSHRRYSGREPRRGDSSRSRSRRRSNASGDVGSYHQARPQRSQLDPMRNLQQTVLMGAHRLRRQVPKASASVVAPGSLILGTEARAAALTGGSSTTNNVRPLTNLELESLFATTTSPATAAALRRGGATASAAAAQLRRTLDARRHERGSEGYLHGWDSDATSEVVTIRSAQTLPQPTHREDEKLKRAQLAQAALANLPEQALDKCIDEDACPICQQVMDKGEIVRRLPCTHIFHSECIARWFRVKLTCPLDGLPVEAATVEAS